MATQYYTCYWPAIFRAFGFHRTTLHNNQSHLSALKNPKQNSLRCVWWDSFPLSTATMQITLSSLQFCVSLTGLLVCFKEWDCPSHHSMHFKLLGSVGTFLKSEFSCVLCFLGLHFYYWYMTSNTSTRFTLKIMFLWQFYWFNWSQILRCCCHLWIILQHISQDFCKNTSNATPPCTCSAPSNNSESMDGNSVYKKILCTAISVTLRDCTSVWNEDHDKVSRCQVYKLLDNMATKRSDLRF
jgi:hypothetical protein